MDLKKL